jgi:SAM-dependent methyltransferase
MGNDIDAAMVKISRDLTEARGVLSADEWLAATQTPGAVQLRQVAHECPYTSRGFRKPRGYAGDAVLLDFIYGGAPLPEATTPRGLGILDWMQRESLAFASVKWRRNHFAELIDQVASREPDARVTVLACGHFREGQRSTAVRTGRVQVTAIDQDPLSLRVVGAEQGADRVVPVCASMRDVITGKYRLPPAQLVYAAGLYDYLAEPFARRLTEHLFTTLEPGGRLVIANFSQVWEVGWMEAFMDWRLVYRSRTELESLAASLLNAGCAPSRSYSDPWERVEYLELQRG